MQLFTLFFKRHYKYNISKRLNQQLTWCFLIVFNKTGPVNTGPVLYNLAVVILLT